MAYQLVSLPTLGAIALVLALACSDESYKQGWRGLSSGDSPGATAAAATSFGGSSTVSLAGTPGVTAAATGGGASAGGPLGASGSQTAGTSSVATVPGGAGTMVTGSGGAVSGASAGGGAAGQTLSSGGTPAAGGSPVVAGGSDSAAGGSDAAGGSAAGGGGSAAGGSDAAGGSAAGGGGSAGVAGMGGIAGAGDVSVTGTFTDVDALLLGRCATSTACHGPGAREVELTGNNLYNTLMSKTVSRCSNQTLVVPFDPGASALVNLLNGGCGNFAMPPACGVLPCTGEENFQMIQSWIENGAAQD